MFIWIERRTPTENRPAVLYHVIPILTRSCLTRLCCKIICLALQRIEGRWKVRTQIRGRCFLPSVRRNYIRWETRVWSTDNTRTMLTSCSPGRSTCLVQGQTHFSKGIVSSGIAHINIWKQKGTACLLCDMLYARYYLYLCIRLMTLSRNY